MKVRTFRKMSTVWTVLGLAAVVALAGIVFTACDTGGGGGGANLRTITLNFYDGRSEVASVRSGDVFTTLPGYLCVDEFRIVGLFRAPESRVDITWYLDYAPFDANEPVTENITLTARWPEVDLSAVGTETDNVIQRAFAYLNDDPAAASYVLVLDANMEVAAAQTVPTDISLVLRGAGAERTISMTMGSPFLFVISRDATLTICDRIALTTSLDARTRPLVHVQGGGYLVMRAGSAIRDNHNEFGHGQTFPVDGGGVLVYGTFTMYGGVISGNAAAHGGGVHVRYGTFIMKDGEISDNTTAIPGSHQYYAGGGGVFVGRDGTFTMYNGVISGGYVTYAETIGGGGVLVKGGEFTLKGGEISDNEAQMGGGVFVIDGGTFTMEGGAISGNTASTGRGTGAGVFVATGGRFIMRDGDISANTASGAGGGGVAISFSVTWPTVSDRATFTMLGGRIFGNTAYAHNPIGGVAGSVGGGVMVGANLDYMRGGIFQMVSGVIYGTDAGELANTAQMPLIVPGLPAGGPTAGDALGTTVEFEGLPPAARPPVPAAYRGTFENGVFTRLDDLRDSDNTIRMLNGEFVEP